MNDRKADEIRGEAVGENVTNPMMNDAGEAFCGNCGSALAGDESGGMPELCPRCGKQIRWEAFVLLAEKYNTVEKMRERVESVLSYYQRIAQEIDKFVHAVHMAIADGSMIEFDARASSSEGRRKE